MKKLSKKMKQLLTLMLAIAMIVTAVPQTGMQVSAAGLEVAETNEESKDEGDSDNRTEETLENEDENQDASDPDADSSDSNDEPAGEELEDEKTEDEEIEDEEIPENETGDDSLPDETEEDEASETEDDVSDSVQDNKENSIMTMAVDDKFTVDETGKLTAYEGPGGDITIPDEVVTIGQGVFRDNNTITSVTLSNTVTTIEQYAFAGCTELTGVTLNYGLVTIGYRAFYQSALGSVDAEGKISGTLEIPGSVTKIEGGAFRGCTNLKEVIFVADSEAATLEFGTQEDGLSRAFQDCPELEKVVLPDRLKTVYSSMFSGDSKLKEVQLGNAVEKIAKYAFDKCSSLQGINLPNTLKEIEYSAFYQAALGSVDAEGKVSGTLEIPGSVEEIGFSAFYGCTYLTEVIFSKEDEAEVLTLAVSDASGNKTFADCPELEKVVLPDRLTIVESSLFNGDSKLKEVQLGNAVVTIKAWAFQDCSSLQEMELPETITEIGASAFRECSSLESINLPEGLETIGGSAFEKAALGSVDAAGKVSGRIEIPGSVQSIGSYAFNGCTHLKEVIFSKENEADVLTLQAWFNSYHTFADCPELEKVVLPNRLKTVNNYMFSADSKLKEVQLGNSVEVIENNSFDGCSSLQCIELPQTLTEIQSHAFNKCTSLKSVNLEEGLVTIGSNAFNMTGISGSLTIPSTVQRIDINAFSSQNLEEVIFENGTTDKLEISFAAFESCVNLKKVLLPNRLKAFSLGVFNNCKSLNILYIPETVTEITGTYPQFSLLKLVIYGTRGSAAETYAKQYNIPFKDKSGLGLYVTGISLSPAKIVRAFALTDEELSKGEVTIQLNVDVKPSTAQNKTVTYRVTRQSSQSSNGQVATVSDSGVITLVGYGTATITATSVDTENGTYTATCEVSVLHQWTDEEKEAARRKLYELNQVGKSGQETPSQFTLVTNVNNNLPKDFPLNTGTEDFTAEWRIPYAVQPGTYSVYDVILKKKGYEDTTLKGMTINGIQVEGITIDGSTTRSVKEKNKITLDAGISIKGYQGNQSNEMLQALVDSSILDYEIHWKSAKPANVTVEQVGGSKGKEAQVTGAKQSKGNAITAELVLKDKDGKLVSTTAANKGTTWFTADIKVDVLNVDVVDGIAIWVTDNSENDPELNDKLTQEISDTGRLTRENIPKETTYNLKATVSVDGKQTNAGDCPLTWSSSDAKVVQVKGQSDGSAVLTVKANTGSATVFVTAAKNGGFSASFKVTLKDSAPRIENTNVTLNMNLEKPESIVTIRPSDGHLVQEDSLKLIDAVTNAESTLFTIERVENSEIEYCIGVKDNAIATGKYKVTLKAATKAAGEVILHDENELPLTIQVNKLTPKVTITQTAIDLYEKDGAGKLEVVSNVPIGSIVYTPNVTSGVRLEQKSTELDEGSPVGSISYGFAGDVNVDSANYKTANAKGTLKVTFAGYKAGTEYNKTITLKTNKTLPKFTAPGITLYTDTDEANSAPVIIKDKSGNSVNGNAEYTVELNGACPDPYDITEQTDKFEWQSPTVTVSSGAKAKTLKFTIRNNKWFNDITTTVSCNVKIGKTPALSFSNAKVILNTKYTLDNYDPVEVKPYIAGFEDNINIIEIKDKDISGKDAKSSDVLNNGALQLRFEDGVIKAGITNAGVFSGTQKYNYLVTAKTSKGLSMTGTLAVTVTASAPSVALKASGSIDLADRLGSKSAVVYKISTKNFTDDIQSVELVGPYANCFDLTYENGAATVRAKENRELKIKTKYQPSVKVTYESGVELIKEVTITPKQSSPKFTTDVTKATLFESAPGEAYGQKIVFSGKTETPIEKIELVSGQNAFAFNYEDDGAGNLYVAKDAYAKTNKTYKLKFAVTLKDTAVNAAPIYVTVQVKYNK